MTTITANTLIQRINRQLAHEGEKLCTARRYPGGWEDTNLGRYFRLDTSRDAIIETHVDLETTGRDLGVLRSDEGVTS
jgi:hypothetical protein